MAETCQLLLLQQGFPEELKGAGLEGGEECVEGGRAGGEVTNSCVHAKGTGAVLLLTVECETVRVTVYDEDRTPPALHEGYDGESGRGLWIVDALTEGRWGTELSPARLGLGGGEGKGVWFELGSGPQGGGRDCPAGARSAVAGAA